MGCLSVYDAEGLDLVDFSTQNLFKQTFSSLNRDTALIGIELFFTEHQSSLHFVKLQKVPFDFFLIRYFTLFIPLLQRLEIEYILLILLFGQLLLLLKPGFQILQTVVSRFISTVQFFSKFLDPSWTHLVLSYFSVPLKSESRAWWSHKIVFKLYAFKPTFLEITQGLVVFKFFNEGLLSLIHSFVPRMQLFLAHRNYLIYQLYILFIQTQLISSDRTQVISCFLKNIEIFHLTKD